MNRAPMSLLCWDLLYWYLCLLTEQLLDGRSELGSTLYPVLHPFTVDLDLDRVGARIVVADLVECRPSVGTRRESETTIR